MSPLAHLAMTLPFAKHKFKGACYALAPDIANLTFITSRTWVPEDDWRVRASRILHSPVVVASIMLVTRGRAWPYALHWVCDYFTHERSMMTWPLRK